jgi:MtrB/PioB family decaheme-associated outer membrane protein
VDYIEIPHRFSQVTRTPYTEVRPGEWRLPDTLQRVNQDYPNSYTNTMVDVLNNTPVKGLDFGTNVLRARAKMRPARGWTVEAVGTDRSRSGYKALGAPFGFNSAIEIMEPIDQSMKDGDIRATYTRDRLTVEAAAGVSVYENRLDRIFVDNPKRITDRTYAGAYTNGDGSAAGQMSVTPDDQVLRGNVALGLQLPRRSTLNATVGISQHTQDEDLLPYTVNTAILQPDTFPLPAKSVDAKALVMNQSLRLTSRAVDNLTGTLRVDHYDYDNQTEELTFPGSVRLDQVWQAGALTNHPYGHTNLTTGVDVDYRWGRQVTVGGTYEWRQREHTLREVEKDAENAFAGRVKARVIEGLEVEARYRRGERSIEDSTLTADYKNAAGTLIEQPGLLRFDVAERTQDLARAGVWWTANEWLVLSGRYDFMRNDYAESPLGLQEDQLQQVTAEATVHATPELDLSGGYGYSLAETDQLSRESSGGTVATADTLNWRAQIKDTNVFVFANAEWWAIPEKLSVMAGYEFSRSFGEYDLSNLRTVDSAKAQDLPATLYRRHDVVIEASYRVLAATDVSVRYGWEQFDVIDFSSEDVPFVNPATAGGAPANAIYLGDGFDDYRAHAAALLVRHRF